MLYGRKTWGPKAWNLLHSFSMNNDHKINDNKKHNYYIFYTTFVYVLPCLVCSEHYSDIIYNINELDENKISRKYLIKWVYETHNIVNDLLDKPKYSYKKFIAENKTINHKDNFYILKAIYLSIDYKIMSFYKYDKIYNFFINFCLLYPNDDIKKHLKKFIKSPEFKNIKTPKEFQLWFIENIDLMLISMHF